MKKLLTHWFKSRNEQIITTFGSAKLVLTEGGHTELRGGTLADQVAAKEWISLFMHEAVPQFRSRQ